MNQKHFKKSNVFLYFSILFIFSLLIFTSSFSHIQKVLSDTLYGKSKALENIIIVRIDDESINKIGRWPWDRDVFSSLFLKLQDAKVIGADISFFEKSNNDYSLNKTLFSMDNVVLACEINLGKNFKPIFNASSGYTNLLSSRDGVLREVQVGLSEEILPLSFEIYKKSYGKEDFKKGVYLINFVSDSFPSISAYDVLQENFSFKGKIVLIGATAPDLHDNYFVPTSKGTAMPGVEIHANILQNLILDNFIEEENTFLVFFVLLIFSFICFFFFSKFKIHYIIPLIVLILLAYLATGIFIFNRFNLLIDFFFFPLSLIVFTGSGIALNYLEEKKHNAYITGAFGKYISKDLLKEIIDKKQELKLGGENREITIFFSDIRDFTSISEKLTPEELVKLINEYLTEMTKIILENKGTVDKFIGDAIMAIWNAPLTQEEHAKLACKSAIAQIKKLEGLKGKWKEKGLPEIKIGCGINTGVVVVGNMGSQERFSYTAMGDGVNLSSRLEGLTKVYGVKIIISRDTKNKIGKEFNCRLLDRVRVKGKKIPVEIYELLVREEPSDFVKEYEHALSLYFARKFPESKREFEKCLSLKKDDKSCLLFVERCKEYMMHSPPKEWDGSFEMKSK